MTGQRRATSRQFLLATRSAGKLRELRPIFDRAGIAVMDLREAGIRETAEEEAIEAFDTFEENALAKARYFNRLTAIPAIADDSGLEVKALGGAPGIRSKRWSGRTDVAGQALDDANNEALLRALDGKPDRSARYVCVAAFADGEREFTVRGETAGRVLDVARGGEGFGYDPYFFSLELGRTFGESPRHEKEVVSHRGRAFRALVARLSDPL